jgi:mannose-1-phosphate guanylyltransferase
MGVFPADHVITKPAKFIRVLRAAFKSADRGQITILGIQPRWPDTAYGYIEFPDGVQPGTAGLQPVRSFREKPNKQTAKKLVAAKRFYWNAGMFFWRTDVALAALRDHQLKTWALLAGLPAFGTRRFGASVAAAFPHCESISIDRGVIEKAKNVVGIPMPDIGWNDVGSWDAVYELLSRDGDGNAAVSELLAYESSGSLVDARGKLVALLGVRDLIVVDTDDALLIADRARAQEVAKLVESLEKRGLDRLL